MVSSAGPFANDFEYGYFLPLLVRTFMVLLLGHYFRVFRCLSVDYVYHVMVPFGPCYLLQQARIPVLDAVYSYSFLLMYLRLSLTFFCSSFELVVLISI